MLEGFLRINYGKIPVREDERSKYCEYDDILGWRGIPFKEGDFRTEGSTTNIKLNSRGFRDRDHDKEKREGKKKILLLGDSFTWGYGVEFADIFFERIREQNASYEFINTAHSGYGIDQEYLMLDSECPEYEPDAVLLMFVLNDFAYIRQDSAHGYQKPYFRIKEGALDLRNVPVSKEKKQLPGKGKSKKVKFNRKYLYKHSLLFKLFEDAREDLQYRVGIKKMDEFYEESDKKWVTGKMILEKMKRYCDNRDIKFLIVLIPNKLQLYTFYDSGNPQRMISRFCREQSIPCLDMLPVFKREFKRNRKELYFDYDPHWNASGHLLAGRLVKKFLEAEL